MALVIETGKIVTGANSYVAVAVCDAYHADRNNAAWGSAEAGAKTAALLNATSYLDGKYRLRWRGSRVNPIFQPLEWPRLGVNIDSNLTASAFGHYAYYSNFPSDQIPPEIIAAVCELALRALSGPLAADITPSDRVSREKVDVIETEYTAKDFTTCYQVVDQLVSRFIRSPNEAVRG